MNELYLLMICGVIILVVCFCRNYKTGQKNYLQNFEQEILRLRKIIDTVYDEKDNLESAIQKNLNEIEQLTTTLNDREQRLHSSCKEVQRLESQIKSIQTDLSREKSQSFHWETIVREKSKGFPTLCSLLEEYKSFKDSFVLRDLLNKKHPAKKASEVVKEETAKRRQAERNLSITQSIIEYYELIAPFLLEFKDEIVDDTEFEKDNADYTEEEMQDEVTSYLTKEEYRKLTITERNQIALDRFWKRRKSKRMIGKIYERYVGYLYESQGYDVNYQGIIKGYEDLGRDLICKGTDEIVIIQCKYWSQFKTIYEKHIFQFFGTVFQYRDMNPLQKVKPIFYTSTELSDLARRFARELNIELKENFPLDMYYPSIKCNIGKEGEKIYHLPLDQQYDKVKISLDEGEFYCRTVLETEEEGFRRAKRYIPVAN